MESRLDYTSVSLAVQRFKDRRLRMKTLGRLAAVNGKRRKSRQMSNVEMRPRVWFTIREIRVSPDGFNSSRALATRTFSSYLGRWSSFPTHRPSRGLQTATLLEEPGDGIRQGHGDEQRPKTPGERASAILFPIQPNILVRHQNRGRE